MLIHDTFQNAPGGSWPGFSLHQGREDGARGFISVARTRERRGGFRCWETCEQGRTKTNDGARATWATLEVFSSALVSTTAHGTPHE
jgi:hypothetical protein